MGSVSAEKHAGAERAHARGTTKSGPSPSTLHRQVKEVEREITRLERQRDTLHDELAGTTEYTLLARVGAEIAEVASRLSAAEERWLALQSELEARR
jgi:predicted  nucleic acid-binding Zn-ribbon protein